MAKYKITYSTAPSNMGGDWSAPQSEIFSCNNDNDLFEKIDSINRNWASVSDCQLVTDEPTIMQKYKQWSNEKTKREHMEKLRNKVIQVDAKNGHGFKVGDLVAFQGFEYRLLELLESDPVNPQAFSAEIVGATDKKTHPHINNLQY